MSAFEQEVRSQPAIWRQAAALAADVRPDLPEAAARIAVVGCGTSYFMAQAVASLRESRGAGEADPFTASDVPLGRAYDAVVVLSRSGTTTEVIRLQHALPSRTVTIAVSAVPGSPVVSAATKAILMEFADERSVVQTRFATATLALFRAALGEDLGPAIADGELALAGPLAVDPTDYEHFVFLGQGWTVGLANEAALKLREACQAWTESYPAMEYRHGPISVAGPRSVVWTLGEVESGLLAQVAETGATVVKGELDPMAELVRIHRVAGALAAHKGLDPDRPRYLTRSVVLPS
jgi:fructoselysine-6-P-deglycase FrlB-like protein